MIFTGIAPRPKELTLKTMFTKIQRGPRTEFFVSLRGASSPLLRYARLSYYIIAAIPPFGELAHATNWGLLRRETLPAT